MAQMRAVILERGGSPDALQIRLVAKPNPSPGFVLIRVKAFGINRTEGMVRFLYRPNIPQGRILGIEAVGVVEAAPGGEFLPGTKVATAMGTLAKQQNGSYAEFVSVPALQVLPLYSSLDWEILGALPQMLTVAYGSIFGALNTRPGHTLLIRGGTTSVGLAATAIAALCGIFVMGTTRNEDHMSTITGAGASASLLDGGIISNQISCKFDKVLELVGTTTLGDSLRCVKEGGTLCLAGMVGGGCVIERFMPMINIPNKVNLTVYHSQNVDFMETPLQKLASLVEAGGISFPIAKVFKFEEIVEAHRYMGQSHGAGKIVVKM